jgi:NAD(P)-dependent dehydrogenase (short-subunit alcohol dehydrogenase family)
METWLTSDQLLTGAAVSRAADRQRNYVVFGGGSGIGLAVATLAVASGAAVTLSDANPDTARLPLLASSTCTFALCDVTSPAQVRRVLGEAGRNGEKLDGVVTTVGGATIRSDLALDLDYWSKEISTNLTSAYIVATAAIEAGVSSIVTTASSFAVAPGPDRVGYSAAKAGVIGLTRSLARATALRGLRVNCVAPGLTNTPRVRRMSGSADEFMKLAQTKPQGRIATTEDVAHAILFLLSDAAQSITGQVVHVNNGSLMP